MENVNRKLKSIYFQWAINYQGPPPRSLSETFEDYLYLERYEYLGFEQWREKILAECNLIDMAEFDMQMILIKDQFNIYSEQKQKKRQRKMDKQWNIHLAYCNRKGIIPF